MTQPTISICLSTYNAERYIASCLTSIRSQNYQQDKVGILIADGGSTDNTLPIAYNYRISHIHNSRKLGEYGLVMNIQRAMGELLIVMAADNELVGKDWLNKVASQFEKPNISAVWGRMVGMDADSSINHYYALIQNDPLTWFTNRNLENYYLEFSSIPEKGWHIFPVEPSLPLPWGANCLVYRSSVIKSLGITDAYLGDNDIFQLMVEKGHNIVAYNQELFIIHHSIDSLWEWVGKWHRNLNQHLIKQYKTRNMRWANLHMGKLVWWAIYALTPIALLHSLWLAYRDRNWHWLWHSPATFLQCIVYLWTFKNKLGVVNAICHA